MDGRGSDRPEDLSFPRYVDEYEPFENAFLVG